LLIKAVAAQCAHLARSQRLCIGDIKVVVLRKLLFQYFYYFIFFELVSLLMFFCWIKKTSVNKLRYAPCIDC
jgi:hypothetical protein